jgi:hypothetical protein
MPFAYKSFRSFRNQLKSPVFRNAESKYGHKIFYKDFIGEIPSDDVRVVTSFGINVLMIGDATYDKKKSALVTSLGSVVDEQYLF